MLSFFFSSRRRHTRCLSDWSSDVCSSDLPISILVPVDPFVEPKPGELRYDAQIEHELDGSNPHSYVRLYRRGVFVGYDRSEERRVGEEGRSRWRGGHKKNKRTTSRKRVDE